MGTNIYYTIWAVCKELEVKMIKDIKNRMAECKAEIEYLQNKDTLYIEPLKRIECEMGYYEDILDHKPRRYRLLSFVKRIEHESS